MHPFFDRFVEGVEETPHHTIYPKTIGGKTRLIFEPNKPMRVIQKRIVRFLRPLAPTAKSSASRKGGSGSVKNRKQHEGNPYLYKLDFSDAFPTTQLGPLVPDIVKRVRKRYPDAPGESEWLEFLHRYVLTRKGTVPHGAVTSSFLFEWYCEMFVDRATRWYGMCCHGGITYTRYVDDLIYTSHSHMGSQGKRWRLRRIVKKAGFLINHEKTEYVRRWKTRSLITGIGVGGGQPIGVPRAWLKETEKMLYRAQVFWPLECEDPLKIQGRVEYLLDVLRGKYDLTALEEKVLQRYIAYGAVIGFDTTWAEKTLFRKGR